MGSETMPMALSMSRYQARPRLETDWSLIWLSGLKCPAAKSRPLIIQLAPSRSDSTRAPLTLPAVARLSADVGEIRTRETRQSISVNPNAVDIVDGKSAEDFCMAVLRFPVRFYP